MRYTPCTQCGAMCLDDRPVPLCPKHRRRQGRKLRAQNRHREIQERARNDSRDNDKLLAQCGPDELPCISAPRCKTTVRVVADRRRHLIRIGMPWGMCAGCRDAVSLIRDLT